MKNHIMQVTRGIFWIINILSVLGISLFVDITTRRICYNFDAREFLNSVQAVPWYANVSTEICVLLLATIAGNMVLREKIYADNYRIICMSLVLDFICCFCMIYILNFNYNGMILLVFANVINYIKEKRTRYFLVAIALASFLLTNYDLISISHNLYSIRNYIQYYEPYRQKQLLGSYNILISSNMVVFIIYCIHIINTQRDTIEEVNSLYKQLQDANNQLKEYTKISEKMIETRERNRVAREIHDTLGHTLTGVSAGIDACIAIVEYSPAQTKKQLEIIAKAVREGIKDIRRSVSALRPDALERLSLNEAVQQMVSEMNKLSGVEVCMNSSVSDLKFDEDEENTIYRVIQEGMTNAIRHGSASKIWIDISRENNMILLIIKDNGTGCKKIKYGFGTKHMKERIEMLGGSVAFNGEDGFVIDAQIPVRWGEKYD